MRASVNNNLSERLQGTFRDRIKTTLRGLDSQKTGQRYLDGWTLTYNLFRGHESLGNKAPGQRAKVAPPFREWADVVKAGAASPRVKREARPSRSSRKPSPPEVAPEAKSPVGGDGAKGGPRKRRIKAPKPVFPKVSNRTPKPKRPPRWARVVPRLPGRN